MSIIRPSNINKRLVGTVQKSPGNAGQVGPTKPPYCCKFLPTLGEQCHGGGARAGVFRSTESYCGRKECCQCSSLTNFGGNLICRASSINWIASPYTSEVSRTWYCRNDANTRAQQVSGCTGWFIPTIEQLSNPGFTCRTYWDSYSFTTYWSSTECSVNYVPCINFFNGGGGCNPKSISTCVRSFRCVTY